MDEKEIRKKIKVLLKKYDLLVSIPERAGVEGEEDATEIFLKHRERIMNSEDPLRIRKTGVNDHVNAFVFGQTILMKSDHGYLDEFVIMSQRFDNVFYIIGMNL